MTNRWPRQHQLSVNGKRDGIIRADLRQVAREMSIRRADELVDEVLALAARFEVHYTPKNASWLNMVELELSAIARQCLHQRIPIRNELTAHVAACVAERNAARATVKWQFTLEKARVKLDRHYQKIMATNLSD